MGGPVVIDRAATLAEVGEFSLISAITEGLGLGADVILGPGDDAAILAVDGPVVTSVDVLVEGVHFRRDWSEAHDVGRKAVAVNVADLEAMGACARGIVVGFSAPPELPAAWVLDFVRGLSLECTTAGVSLLGGDVTKARDITVSVTVLGGLQGRDPVRRSGAEPGDVVAVHGRLGWAAAGLAVLGRGFRSPRAEPVHCWSGLPGEILRRPFCPPPPPATGRGAFAGYLPVRRPGTTR